MDNPYFSLPREELLRRKAELENDIAANGGSVPVDYGAMSPAALMRRKAELEGSIAELRPRIAQMDGALSQMRSPAPAPAQEAAGGEPANALGGALARDPDYVPNEDIEGTELGFMGNLRERNTAQTGISWETVTGNRFLQGALDVLQSVWPLANEIMSAQEGEKRLALADALKTGNIDATWTDGGATTRALNRVAREWDETEGAKYDLYRRNAEGGALNEELGDIAKMERGKDGRLHPVLDENGNFVLDEKYAGPKDEARKEAIRSHARGMLELDAIAKDIASRKVARDTSSWWKKGLASAVSNAGYSTGFAAGEGLARMTGLSQMAQGVGGAGGKLLGGAAALALPVVVNAVKRYYQLRADDVYFDEDGRLRTAGDGLGVKDALVKGSAGSLAENLTEVALGKVADTLIGGSMRGIVRRIPGAKSMFGKAAASAPTWLKRAGLAIAEGYGRMQNYTHLDGFPGEMAEEFVQGAFDDVLGLDLKDPRQKKQMGQFTREFFDWDKNFKDLAVGMLFTMAGQAALGVGAGRIRNQMNSMSREVRGVLKANGWTDAEIEDASYKQRLATAMSLSPELSYNMRYGAAELARLGGMSENDIKKFTENGDLPYAVFALSDAMNTGVADQEGKEGGRAVTLRPTAVTDADGNMFVGKNGKVQTRLAQVESKGLDEIKEFMTHFSQAQQDALNLVNERMALDGWRGLTQADLDAYGDTSGFNGKEKDRVFWFSGENGDKVATDNATGTKIVDVGGNGEMYTISHPGLNTDYIAYGWESARNWADRAAKLAQAKEARRGWKQGFVQDMVKRIVPDGGKAPSVRYYNTVTDIMSDETLPAALREQAVREGAEGGGQAVTLPDGSVAVFLDNIHTPGQAAVGIVHEIAGHGALDAFFTGKEGGAEKRADLNRRRRAASEEALGEDVVKDVEKYYADSALDEELNVRANEGIGGNAVSGLGRTAVLPVGQGRFQRLASRLRQFLARRTGMQFDLTPDEWDAVVVEGLERMARGDSFPRPQTAPRRTDLPAAKTRTDIGEMVRGSADKTMAKMREAQRKATILLGYTPGLSGKDKEKLDKLLDAKRKWAGTDEFENAVAKYRDLVRQYRTAQAANKNTPKGEEKPYSKEQMKEMRDAISTQWKVLQAFGESEAMQKHVAEKQKTKADEDSGLGELFETAENIEAEAEAEEEAETPKEPEKPVETPAPEVKEVKETPKEPSKESPKAEAPAKTPVEAPRSAPAEKATTTPPKGADVPQGEKSADLGAVQDEAEDEGKTEMQKAAAPALKAVVDAVRSAAKFIEGGIETPAGILNNLKYALRGLKKHPYAHWDLPLGGNRKATLDDIGDVNEAAQVLAKAVAKEGETPSDTVVARLAELLESELGANALRDHDLDVVPREVRETKAKKEKSEEELAQAEADEEARGNLVSAVQSAVESGDLSALKKALEPFKKDPNLSWNFGQGSGWNLDRLGANKNKAKWNRIPESIVNMGGQFILSNAVVTDFVRNVAGERASEENVKAAVAAIRDALGGAPAQRHAQAVVNEDIRAERREKAEMNSQVRRMERMNKVADFLYRHYQMDRATALRLLSQLDEMRDFIDWMNPRNTDSGMYNYARPTDAVHGTEWDNLGFMWDEITGRDPLYELWLTDADESDYDTPPGGNNDAPWMDFSGELHPEDQIVRAIVDRIKSQHDQFRDIVAKWKSLPEGLREQIKKTGLSGKMGERIRRRFDKLQRDLYAQAESALSGFQESRDLAKAEKDYAKLAESYDAMDDDAKQVVAALSDLIDERKGADQYAADSIALREAFLAAHPNSDPFAADITREDIEEAREYIGDEAADRLQREKDFAEMDWTMADTAAEDDGSPLPFRKAGRGAVDGLRGDVDWLIGGGDRASGVFNRWRLGSAGIFDAAVDEFGKKKIGKAPRFSRKATETPTDYTVRRLTEVGDLLDRYNKAGAANKGSLWAQIRPLAAALEHDVRNGDVSVEIIRRRWDDLPSAARVAAICALSEEQLKRVIPMSDPRIAKFGGNRYWESEESLTEAERKLRIYALDAARRVEARTEDEIEADEEGLLADAPGADAEDGGETDEEAEGAEWLDRRRRAVRRAKRAETALADEALEADLDAATKALAAYSGMGARNIFSNTDMPDGELFKIANDLKQRDGDRMDAMAELFRRNYPYVLGQMFRKMRGNADAKDAAMEGILKALGFRSRMETVIDPKTGEERRELVWRWTPSNAEFKGGNSFRSYALKTAQNVWLEHLRQLGQKRVGESVVAKPRTTLSQGEDGKLPDWLENLKAGEVLGEDGMVQWKQRTADEWEAQREIDALKRHSGLQYRRWKATQSLERRALLNMVERDASIAEIAAALRITESAAKTRVAETRKALREALSNPFAGTLFGATSVGARAYDDVLASLSPQQRQVWNAYRAANGDLGAVRDSLRRDWEMLARGDRGEGRRILRKWAEREAADVTPLDVLRERDVANLRARGVSEAIAAKMADRWMENRRELRKTRAERERAERERAVQGDLFAALAPADTSAADAPWNLSDEHIRMLVRRTEDALAIAGLNPDGSLRKPKAQAKVPMIAQEQLTPEAAKEASGVPMMARREPAKEAPKAEAAPAPSIPGLKRQERAVQGDLFDMKWRKGTSPEQQRIIGVLEKLMTDEGTPDMRWRKAQDVLKKEGLFGGAMSEHIARMRKQEFPDGSTEKVGAESLVIRTGDTVKKYRDARSFTKADLDKIMWHNDLFGDRTPYEFKDVVYDDSWSGDYRPARIVLEQPYVEIREGGGAEARRLLVEDLKRRFGADDVKVKGDPSSEGMEIDAGPYHIADLKDLNIGIDERTGDYAVWDANIERRRDGRMKWRRGAAPESSDRFRNIVKRFGTTDNFGDALLITPGGNLVSSRGGRIEHRQLYAAENRIGEFTDADYSKAAEKLNALPDIRDIAIEDPMVVRHAAEILATDIAKKGRMTAQEAVDAAREDQGIWITDILEEGGVRVASNNGGLEIGAMPTEAVADRIWDYIAWREENDLGNLSVDFVDAERDNEFSVNYSKHTSPSKIVSDIREYFESGEIPKGTQTSVSDFRWRKSAPFSAEADSAAMTEDERRTIEEMRRDPKFSYSGYMAERAHDRTGELARGESKLANATSFLEKAKLFFTDREVNQFVRDRIREGLQDQHIHLRRMEERMFGGLDKIDKGADLYYFRDANIGRAGNLEMEFEREMITPLHDEIKKLGDNGMDRLNLVLNALHAPERNRMIAERTDGKTLDGSGMTTAFAKAVLDKAAADGFLKAEFDSKSKTYRVTGGKAAKAVGLVRRIIDTTRQLQVQSGRKNAADAKNEARLSPNYVPLRTDMEDTLKEFAHAFGRQSLADSPVAYSELLLKAAMSGFYENVERRRLAQLVQRFPGYGMVFNTAAGDILTETQVERFKKFLDYMKEHGGAMTERMAEELEPLGISSQKELEARLAASGEGLPVRKSLVNGKVRESVDTAALDRKYPDIVSYMRDGQVWFVRLGGEKLSKAEAARIGEEVKKSGMLRLNLALKTIRKATRWFSQLRTSYSPEFLVSNFFADNRQAVQNIMSTFGAKAAAQFERNIGSVFGKNSARASAARYLRGELDPAKYAIDRYTQEWAKNGGRIGGMSFSNFKDVDDGIRKLVRDYEQAARGDKKLAALGKKIKKGVEDLNAAVEMGTRIAAYATCRENGYSVPDAVSYSRDITVNFDRRGNWTPVLNSLYAFSNASIQDVHRTLVAIGGPADWAKKGGKRGLAVLAGMALLGFLRAALGYGQDDPEEAVAGLPQYEYTSEYEKQDMFGLRVGKANYAIPIRGLARLPYYAGQKVYEVLADKTSAADAAKDLGSFVAQNVVDPIGNSDNLLQTVAPSIIRPAVEYAQNTNFAGNQIFRQPRSSKDVKSEMGYRNTQGVFKWAARALNELTGGSASRSGAIDMQPEKIQHIYSAITGSLGADLLRAGNFAYDLANGEDVLAVDKARNVPFLRRVRRDLAANSRTFRDAKDRYEADLQDWNANEGNSAVRAEIARSAPYLADERWAQELKDLSNAAQKLMTEENKAEGEERKAAQELRMRVQALFIRRLKEPPRQTPFAREQKQAQKESALFLKKRKESQKRTERRGRIPMMP